MTTTSLPPRSALGSALAAALTPPHAATRHPALRGAALACQVFAMALAVAVCIAFPLLCIRRAGPAA